MNPARILIGCDEAMPICSDSNAKPLLNAMAPDSDIESAWEQLMAYAEPLCRNVDETELPPLRAINHTILLIDENKTYPLRASRWQKSSENNGQGKRRHI